MNKKRTIIGLIAVVVIALVVAFSGCIEEKVPSEEQDPQIVKRTEEYSYISLEELYRDTPANLTDRKAWEQWGNKYKGKYVKETGRLDTMSIFPQEGKLFLIIAIQSKEGYVENNATQVAFYVKDASTVRLGEKEGTFIINDIKRICLGDTYTFSGKVSNFSSFDMDLVYSGHEGLIIVEGKLIDIS